MAFVYGTNKHKLYIAIGEVVDRYMLERGKQQIKKEEGDKL